MFSDKTEFITGLVSVVTPVYNNEAYLSEMLDSVLSQTYDDIQMILVDDGSSDKTPDIAESYRLRFLERGYEYTVIHAEHSNAAGAVSAGLKFVKGEYIIWPDSDDILLPETVEKRISFLKKNPQYDAVRSLPEYFDAQTLLEAKPRENIGYSTETHIFWDILEGRSYVSCGCYMLRSVLFFEIYPERDIPIYDVGQNFQMLLPYMYFHTCATLPEKLYRVRIHNASHSVRKLDFKDELHVLRGFSDLIDDIAEICHIDDIDELARIEQWKKQRRVKLRRRTVRRLPVIKTLLKLKYSSR